MVQKNSSLQEYQLYLKSYFFMLLFSLGLVSIFNIVIDPYQYFFTQKIIGLNATKPEYEKHIMLSKAAEAKQIKAKTILLGSSRVMSSLDSSHAVFKDSKTVYNLGLPGTNMYQSLQYFKHALHFQKGIEQVVIGIDFFMFNEYLENLDSYDETRLKKKLVIRDLINTSLSMDALQASLTTINANIKNNEVPDKESTNQKFQRWLTNFLNFEGFYKTYSLSQKQLDSLRMVINLCQQHNINYYIYISPTHATQYEAIDRAGLWLTFEQWKREVVSITPIWDFSGYNSVTTELISESMVNYIDNSHYSKYTGELVLNKMFNYEADVIPQDFGILLNSNNLETHLDKIKLDRQKWRKSNFKEVELVKKVKARVEQANKEAISQ